MKSTLFHQSIIPYIGAVFLMFGMPTFIYADTKRPNDTPREIKVVLRKEAPSTLRPVQLVPGAPAPIDAWVMGETLSMTFLTDLGEAEVTVSADMSAWSVTETFDTADGTLLLTVDTDPGDYTITVTTSDASYIGGYSVE